MKYINVSLETYRGWRKLSWVKALKVSNSIEDEMTKMSWWIRHGIVEEYKKYGIVEGESTLYVQDVSLNKLNKLKFGLKSRRKC